MTTIKNSFRPDAFTQTPAEYALSKMTFTDDEAIAPNQIHVVGYTHDIEILAQVIRDFDVPMTLVEDKGEPNSGQLLPGGNHLYTLSVTVREPGNQTHVLAQVLGEIIHARGARLMLLCLGDETSPVVISDPYHKHLVEGLCDVAGRPFVHRGDFLSLVRLRNTQPEQVFDEAFTNTTAFLTHPLSALAPRIVTRLRETCAI